MFRRSILPFHSVLVLLALASFPAAGQTVSAQNLPAAPQAGPEAIRQDKPSFYVHAELNRASGAYREREAISLRIASEENAYLYVLYKQADAKVFLIFPNSIQPDNRILARQAVLIPDKADRFDWSVGPPFGKEIIKVIASKEPLPDLQDPELRKQRFNPVTSQQVKALAIELHGEHQAPWGDDELELTTYPLSHPLDGSRGKRWGVFFGVSQYEFDVEKEKATSGKSRMNLSTPHRDARKMDELLRDMGQLSGAQVFTNEQATRRNLELAITGWLPRMSRPGDTVFIYFSGHGMQISDDGGDEADGKDEVLLPYDYLGIDVLSVLLDKAKAGELDSRVAPRVVAAVNLLKQAGSIEKGAWLLARQSAVSDDLFGHWMQRLAGRQVVAILDICHAGGFAAQEKSLPAPVKMIPFDFLDGEATRLKDLGQRDLAMLAACGAQETAAIRVQDDLSVLTYYLVESIDRSVGSLTLDQAFQECRGGMANYFSELNRARQAAAKPPMPEHQPSLMNLCAQPVLLKP